MGGYDDGRGGYTFRWTGLGGLPGDPALTFLARMVSAEMAKDLVMASVCHWKL